MFENFFRFKTEEIGEGVTGEEREGLFDGGSGRGRGGAAMKRAEDEAVAFGIIEKEIAEEGLGEFVEPNAGRVGIGAQEFEGVGGSGVALFDAIDEALHGGVQEGIELLAFVEIHCRLRDYNQFLVDLGDLFESASGEFLFAVPMEELVSFV